MTTPKPMVKTGATALLVVTLAATFWLSTPAPARAERDTIDRIIAVVGDKVILASELASQMQLVALQSKQRPRTQAEMEKLQRDVLDQMVSDQLFLVAAEQDTTINIREDEIEKALDAHVARVSQNFESNEAFEAALAAEGLTVRELKKRYRNDIKGQLLKQRFMGRKLSSVSVSRHEVEAFFNDFRDSIPAQPEAVKLSHVLLAIRPSERVEDSIKAIATDLRQRVLDGADFASLSTQFSSSGAGANGGDLGWVARDDVVEEFGRAAFSLQVGDISGVIRTQFGYHVILCEGKRDDKARLRHILLTVPATRDDTVRTARLADSLLQVARDGGDFALIAKAFSEDNNSRARGGELGWFAVDELPQEFVSEVAGWKTPGEYRGPVLTEFGLHILYLMDYQPEHQYTFDDDYDAIKELARQEKTAALIEDWLDDFEGRTYIDLRLEE